MTYREPPRTNTQDKTRNSGGMNPEEMKNRAGQATQQARHKASEATETAAHAVDERRGQAAEQMDSTAQQVRERGESLPGGERTTEMAEMAAEKIEATSSYVREHDVQDMMSDLETLVRNNPTQSLIAAAAAGFLVGRMLR
jgi:ElaB/YqjD/DUF883 family membrane-anchored ribosome-binding protein